MQLSSKFGFGNQMCDYLSEDVVRRHADQEEFLNACRRGYALYGSGELTNPARREWIDKNGSFNLVMEAEWAGRYCCRKIIKEHSDITTGELGERRAVLKLTDLRSESSVEMDANALTDLRTGASAAVGLEYVCEDRPRHVAIVGTGRVALQIAIACDAVFDLESITVTSRRPENRTRFVEAASVVSRARIEAVADIPTCVEKADTVVTAVPTPRPVLTRSDVGGRFLVAVGGDARTRQLASDIIEELVVLPDLLEQTLASGEFVEARMARRIESIRFARAGEVVLDIGDAASGRLQAERPQVLYLTGMAALDLCAATSVYENFKRAQST